MNSDEKVDFKYFIKLALSRNISWHIVTLLFDESTSTLEKSKELNNALVEELKNLLSGETPNEFVENSFEDFEAEEHVDNLKNVDEKEQSDNDEMRNLEQEFTEYLGNDFVQTETIIINLQKITIIIFK